MFLCVGSNKDPGTCRLFVAISFDVIYCHLGNKTCLNKGNCTDLWNLYRCDCPWPFGGKNCELYGCEWTNPCPDNETCVNLKKTSEYECKFDILLCLALSYKVVIFVPQTPPPPPLMLLQFALKLYTNLT